MCGAAPVRAALRPVATLLRSKRNRGRLALLAALHLVAELLALMQTSNSRLFDGRNVHEHVLRAIVGLDEPVTPLGVKPLYGSGSHCKPFKENHYAAPATERRSNFATVANSVLVRAREWHAEPRSRTAHTWVGYAADTRNVVKGCTATSGGGAALEILVLPFSKIAFGREHIPQESRQEQRG